MSNCWVNVKTCWDMLRLSGRRFQSNFETRNCRVQTCATDGGLLYSVDVHRPQVPQLQILLSYCNTSLAPRWHRIPFAGSSALHLGTTLRPLRSAKRVTKLRSSCFCKKKGGFPKRSSWCASPDSLDWNFGSDLFLLITSYWFHLFPPEREEDKTK